MQVSMYSIHTTITNTHNYLKTLSVALPARPSSPGRLRFESARLYRNNGDRRSPPGRGRGGARAGLRKPLEMGIDASAVRQRDCRRGRPVGAAEPPAQCHPTKQVLLDPGGHADRGRHAIQP